MLVFCPQLSSDPPLLLLRRAHFDYDAFGKDHDALDKDQRFVCLACQIASKWLLDPHPAPNAQVRVVVAVRALFCTNDRVASSYCHAAVVLIDCKRSRT